MSVLTRTMRPSARGLVAVALVATLTACAGPAEDDDAAADPGATSSPSPSTPSPSTPSPEGASTAPPASPSSTPSTQAPAGPTLEVTVGGDEVTPNAKEIALPVGEPLTIAITADRAGELHVHSKPEQYVEFDAGKSTEQVVITTPGTVEIEEHDTGAVVAVVEAS